MFVPGEAQELRTKWEKIQTGFVDEPRKAVQDADALVAAATKRLAEIFAEERAQMERDWDRGDDVSTEDLRIALRRYRSFFDRLLSVYSITAGTLEYTAMSVPFGSIIGCRK